MIVRRCAIVGIAVIAIDGTQDMQFGAAGSTSTEALGLGCQHEMPSVVATPDGKVIAVTSGTDHLTVFRPDRRGRLDASFGHQGVTTLADRGAVVVARPRIAVGQDGSLVVGWLGTRVGQGDIRFTAARLTADGLHDQAFGTSGIATLPVTGSANTPPGLAVQANGRVVLAHSVFDGGSSIGIVVRFTAAGDPDPEFGRNGVAYGVVPSAFALAIQGDRIVVATNTGGVRLHRLTPSGELDVTFGQGGQFRSTGLLGGHERNADMVIDAMGRIVLAGANGPTTVARLSPHGALDAGFGEGGYSIIGTTGAGDAALAANGTDVYVAFDGPYPPALKRGSVAVVRVAESGQSRVAAVEFHHAALDHYFITAQEGEIAALDTGEMAGWARTGQTVPVFPSPLSTMSPVCRFYIPPALGDSHFYSASASECAETARKFPALVAESPAVFHAELPDASGRCLWGRPVYRLWNRRSDSNHRYTLDRATRDAMIKRGYVLEGYGKDGVAMCSPW